MTAKLERATFSIGRELEYFTEKELQMQIGHDTEWWPAALLKELIDNALDACEAAGIAPVIEVEVETDSFSVRDNGPGLPRSTLVGSLDYLKRVSDKAFYVSPTRGQMGNALKTVWAAPFVADGERGCVEVFTQGMHYTIDVTLDRIEQRPRLELAERPSRLVKKGTLVRVHWSKAASSLLPPPGRRILQRWRRRRPAPDRGRAGGRLCSLQSPRGAAPRRHAI